MRRLIYWIKNVLGLLPKGGAGVVIVRHKTGDEWHLDCMGGHGGSLKIVQGHNIYHVKKIERHGETWCVTDKGGEGYCHKPTELIEAIKAAGLNDVEIIE